MSEAQREYVRRGRTKVAGWFYRLDAEIFGLLTDHQNSNALDGSLVEIGLHHGQSFIALCLSLRDGQRAYGIDLFEQQSLNLDRSGKGDRSTVEKNLQAAGVDLAAIILDARASTSVTSGDILGSVGAARFFSIDGGHQREVVRSDLLLAEQTLAEHGVVALDDFLRPEWPDVSAGYFAWFETSSKSIVPFAIGLNKLYLCRQSYVGRYQQVLRSSEFLKFFLVKDYNFGGNGIPVFQRFLQPDWGPMQRLAEHVKFFHPDLYVTYRGLRSALRPRPFVRTSATRLAPRLVWRHRVRSWPISTDEPEAMLLPRLANRSKLSIDVGAAQGSYTALLVPLSRRVIAFEPVPQFAEELRKMFSGTAIVQIEQVALSDQSGSRHMRVRKDSFRSTIESGNELRYSANVEAISVKVSSLDEYSFCNVGFIKIDVEGHDLAVLRGAADTIHRERPNVLIEVEEQHRRGALEDAFGFFKNAGYLGFFLLKGKLESLAAFDHRIHQDVKNLDARGLRTGLYVNNFIFVSADNPMYPRLMR
jgi:FkbM family methyltransferase